MNIATMVDAALDALDPNDPMRSARKLVEKRFTDENGHRLLHQHRGGFWRFTDNHYDAADTEHIRAVTWKFLETAKRLVVTTDKDGKPIQEFVPFKPNSARVSNVADALAAACSLDSRIEPPAWIDKAEAGELPPANEMMPVANGLLHLPTGEIYAATPNYFGLNASEVVFDPDAPAPAHFLAFLAQLFGDDIEAIETLQDWFGYVLSCDTSQQKILLIVGPKRGGKGTIARVLTALLGRDNVAAPTLAGLQTNFGLAPLISKPLAIISDARLGGRADQAAIAERLLSISGEDSLTIDRKFSSAWTGRMPTRFMMLTNELPRIADASGALASRFIALVLRHSFYGREDTGLAKRLLTELSGILNWSLVGYRRLRNTGHFTQPMSSNEAIAELEALSSPITAYVRERCLVGPQYSVPVELIYQDYRVWCENNGRKDPPTTARC
jgi:putative DNA primase/helicase